MKVNYFLARVLLVFIFLISANSAWSEDYSGLSSAQIVGVTLKNSLEGSNAIDIKNLMTKKYQLLRLMDDKGIWKDPTLENIGAYLLPDDIDSNELSFFIDSMVNAAEANTYLNDFLEETRNRTFSTLFNKVQEEGAEVLPDVIAYALTLERLTKSMREDWNVMLACQKIWLSEREDLKVSDYLSVFGVAKLASIEFQIGIFDDYHESGKVPSYSLKVMLPVNILEAVLTDQVRGYRDNADAGLILAKNPAGVLKFDPDTGAGPSRWSSDSSAILFSPPLPLEWANLYATWNMAFVSSYQNFPYFLCKLLIPQVNNFKHNPEEYLYNRVLALYTHIYFALFQRVDNTNTEMNWNDNDLTELWGEINRTSAGTYQRAVWKAKYFN